MSDFYDELEEANAALNEEAGEPFTYDGVSYARGLFMEPDVSVQILAAGEDSDDELTVDVEQSLFASPPVAKKRLVYNGVTYNCRAVFPVSGGLYRFRIYRA